MKRSHRTIYLKETTINLEKNLLKFGFDVNFSDIYEEALQRKLSELNGDLGSFFKQKMVENRQKMVENRQKMRYFEQKLRDFEAKKSKEIKEKAQKNLKNKKKEENDIITFSDHIKCFFGLEDEKQISELAQKYLYIKNQDASITLFDFMKSRGIKPVEEIQA